MVADEEFELRLRFGHWEHQAAHHSTSKKSKDPAPKDLPPLPKCDPMYIACPGTRFAGWMPLAGASDLEVKADAGRPSGKTKRIYVLTSFQFISMAAKARRAADRNRSYRLFAEPPFFTCKHRARMFVRAFFLILAWQQVDLTPEDLGHFGETYMEQHKPVRVWKPRY